MVNNPYYVYKAGSGWPFAASTWGGRGRSGTATCFCFGGYAAGGGGGSGRTTGDGSNDTYGHDAGDFVLKKFAEIIGQTKRSNDILARYGGEEFILLFFETDKSEALKILISIQNAIVNKKIVFHEFEIECTFSCGLVDLQEFADMARIDDLIRDADKRMYTAKLTGRNRIIYEG